MIAALTALIGSIVVVAGSAFLVLTGEVGVLAHREGDAVSIEIYFRYGDVNFLSNLHHFGGVGDVFVGQL